MIYNREKMLKLIHSDRYLLTTYLDMMEINTNEDIVLKSLFNMNVEEDENYWKAYKEIE